MTLLTVRPAAPLDSFQQEFIAADGLTAVCQSVTPNETTIAMIVHTGTMKGTHDPEMGSLGHHIAEPRHSPRASQCQMRSTQAANWKVPA